MTRIAQLYGRKFECGTCTCVFYDLKRPDPICPGCASHQHLVRVAPGEPSSRARSTTLQLLD